MSLKLAAQHLASHGRGDDKVLVHMTPREVKSLNELAMAHGGQLTINPKTGLPEAGFLSAILPMAAGAASTYFTGNPYLGMALAGGGKYAQTGSLTQGLMAGLGAYGGGQLAAGLGGIGASEAAAQSATAMGNPATVANAAESAALAENATALQSQQAAMNAGFGNMDPGMIKPLSASDIQATRMSAIDSMSPSVADPIRNVPSLSPTSGGNISAGAKSLFTDPTADKFKMLGGGSYSGLAKSGLMAAAPALIEEPNADMAPLKGDSDMGPRYRFNRGLAQPFPQASTTGTENNYFPGQGYERISGDEAKSLYGYADGGDVEENPYRTSMDDSLEVAYEKAQEKNDTAKMRAIEREMEIRSMSKAGMEKGLSGIKGLNAGGMSNLGGYSDGGRLLRGPGDGVSDSIPAMIGKKQPARLADGEFVVPARIVSELGNGSTEAGARKLYAMMDRVQSARKKTVGKNKVAHNSRADKFLPA
jgi:hypothetical protein